MDTTNTELNLHCYQILNNMQDKVSRAFRKGLYDFDDDTLFETVQALITKEYIVGVTYDIVADGSVQYSTLARAKITAKGYRFLQVFSSAKQD